MSTSRPTRARRPPSLRERMAAWVGTFSADDEAIMTSLGAEFLCAFVLPATYALYGMPERLSINTAWSLSVMLYLLAFLVLRSAAVMAIRKKSEDGDEVRFGQASVGSTNFSFLVVRAGGGGGLPNTPRSGGCSRRP